MTRLTIAQARTDVMKLESRLCTQQIATLEKNTIPEDFPGPRFSEVTAIQRRDARCTCGQLVDVWEGTQRLLIGCNAGTSVWFSRYSCPACNSASLSNHQRVLA